MEGFTVEEITEKINAHNAGLSAPISAMSVYDDLKQCRSMWLKTVVWAQNEMRISAVQELRRVRRAAWDAFEKSKEPAKRRSIEMNPDTGLGVGNICLTEESQCGDPRFLDKVVQTIVEECKVLDLYPNEPSELGTEGNKRVSIAVMLNTGGKTLEELAYFPVRGELINPQISPPPFQLNGKDGLDGE